jgi:uncharacterized membrane protein YphA (DoxX/SURF4 family)
MGTHARGTRGTRGRPAPPARGRPSSATFPAAVVGTWRAQSWPARILRTFLGSTFVYAGIQKLADPGFLRAGSPTYIGTQLAGFARGSPIGGLLRLLGHAAVPAGVAIALLELAIGLATLAGVAPVSAAIAGAVVNVALLLSATWHVHPYFLGSDSIYAVAWIAYAAMLLEGRKAGLPARRRVAYDPTRRDALRSAIVAAATLFLGGAAAAASRLVPRNAADGLIRGAGPTAGTPSGRRTTSSGPTTTGDGGPPGPRPGGPGPRGRLVARLSDVPVGDGWGSSPPGASPLSWSAWASTTWSRSAGSARTPGARSATTRAPGSSCARATGPSSTPPGGRFPSPARLPSRWTRSRSGSTTRTAPLSPADLGLARKQPAQPADTTGCD